MANFSQIIYVIQTKPRIGGYNLLTNLWQKGINIMTTTKQIPEMKNNRVRSCGVQGCCPTIDFTDPQNIILKDDFGGKICLTKDQWEWLRKESI